MVKLYNFLGSWQLFPEKGDYGKNERPLSGIYRIEIKEDKISIFHSWTTISQQGFSSEYNLLANEERQEFNNDSFAEEVQIEFKDSIEFTLLFFNNDLVLKVKHNIEPNGYLKITQEGFDENGEPSIHTEYYHRQMSVLPYSASVAGALIKPTEEGVIRHKALTAMEEQTNMQLVQIRRQIELLALQAQEIYKRKELSEMIYSAKLPFKPEMGHIYHLYQKEDGSHQISMISPQEWGAALPFKRFVARVQLLADHTWKELD